MPTFFEVFDSQGTSIDTVPLPDLGDNSEQSVLPDVGGVRRVVLNLGGSGALAALEFCPDDGHGK